MKRPSRLILLPVTLAGLFLAASLPAADGTWTGANNANWGTPGSWSGSTIAENDVGTPTATAYFNNLDLTAARTVNLDAPRTIGNIVFEDTAPGTLFSYTISGSTLTLDTTTGTAPTITANSGTAASPHLISSIIAGSDGVTIAGSGVVRFTGANTFSGNITVNSGATLSVQSDTGFGNAANDINLNGGTLRTEFSGGNTTFGTGRDIFLGAAGGTINAGATSLVQTIAANISGTDATLTITGSGPITLTGTNTYTGGTILNGGRAIFNTSAIPTTGLITINQAATVVLTQGFGNPANLLVNTKLSTSSSGVIGVSGNSTSVEQFVGVTIDMSQYGSLFLGAHSESNFAGNITPAGNTYRLGGGTNNLRMGRENQLVDGGTARSLIVGNGVNGGTVIFNNGNTFSGGTTVNASGTAYLRHNTGLGSGNITVNTNGALRIDNNVTVANAIILAGDNTNGSVNVTGGANTLNGDITTTASSRIVTANTAGVSLAMGNISIGAGTLILTTGPTSGTAAGGNMSITGNITGAGAMTKNGTGTLNFNGTSSIAGLTTVSVGTVSGNATFGQLSVTGGRLAPGNSIGTMNAGNTSFGATSTLAVEFGSSGGTPVADLLNVTGSVTLTAGANLELTLFSGLSNPQVNDIFFLVTNDGVDTVNGVFTKLNGTNTTLAQGSNFQFGDIGFQISYTGNYETGQTFTGGNDIALRVVSVVPEPESGALLMAVLGGLILLRRRR
jgi:autotransporter-associated beta strand protein